MTGPPFGRGLVLGKFAPLHRGHELVIRRALAECAEVVLLSWTNPELPGCSAERRERWLAARFPEAIRLVATDAVLAARARGELAGWRVPRDDDPPERQRRFTALLCRDLLGDRGRHDAQRQQHQLDDHTLHDR